jgi:hypothetical protein
VKSIFGFHQGVSWMPLLPMFLRQWEIARLLLLLLLLFLLLHQSKN